MKRSMSCFPNSTMPIVGLVHGAGVLADKKIQDKSSDDFAWVYDVKVQGMGFCPTLRWIN